jgi:CheY-like chemotaxis protein
VAKPPRKRLKVWLVDDLASNRDDFKTRHQDHFHVQVFSSITTMKEKLDAATRAKKPDAILCDVYFFDEEAEAQAAEDRVAQLRPSLDAMAVELKAEKHAAGVELIEYLKPAESKSAVFAFTSKAPYLMHGDGFERIAKAGAAWLFKGKLGAEFERVVIEREVRDVRSSKRWRPKWQRAWTGGFRGIAIGAVLGASTSNYLLPSVESCAKSGWHSIHSSVPSGAPPAPSSSAR